MQNNTFPNMHMHRNFTIRTTKRIQISIHTHTHTYIHTYIHIYTYIYIYCMYISLFIYLFMYVCTYVCMYVRMYVYVCMYVCMVVCLVVVSVWGNTTFCDWLFPTIHAVMFLVSALLVVHVRLTQILNTHINKQRNKANVLSDVFFTFFDDRHYKIVKLFS